jgi:hypothetical protein
MCSNIPKHKMINIVENIVNRIGVSDVQTRELQLVINTIATQN